MTAIGVHSPNFTIKSRIVIVVVTANPAFVLSLFFSWQRKVQKKNKENLNVHILNLLLKQKPD